MGRKPRIPFVLGVSAVLVLGMALGAAITLVAHEGWSGASQALIGAVGIGIAIYVPWNQRQAQIDAHRLEEERLIEVMRVALRQPVGTFAARCNVLHQRLSVGDLVANPPPKELFDRPPEFDQFRIKLPLLGNLGAEINQLICEQNEAWVICQAVRESPVVEKGDADFYMEMLAKFRDRAERCAVALSTKST